jgi:hypothetical protein
LDSSEPLDTDLGLESSAVKAAFGVPLKISRLTSYVLLGCYVVFLLTQVLPLWVLWVNFMRLVPSHLS